MRQQQDDDMAHTIVASVPTRECLRPVYAGRDCWASTVARGGSGITTNEVFAKAGIALRPADTDLVNGGRAVRRAMDFKRDETGAFTKHSRVYVVDTPGNRRVLAQLAEIMPDEDNVNKPEKVDADSEGRGGDDGADMFRYGIASHPPLAVDTTPSVQPQDRSPVINWKEGTVKRPSAERELNDVFASSAKTRWTQRPRWT
jgi:hypothetical protein